jgi:hypothetical protein
VTTEEFGMGWKLLIEYYADQRKDLSDDERIKQRNIYFKFLKDMDGSLWQEVVGVAIQSSKWFPRIAELVEYAAQLHRVRVPDQGADAAFEHALTAVRRLDPFSRRPMSPVRDDVDRTVRSIGGWGISLAGIARSSSPPGKEPTGSESGSGWSETPWGRRLIMDSERFDKLLNGRWVVGSPTQPPGREC